MKKSKLLFISISALLLSLSSCSVMMGDLKKMTLKAGYSIEHYTQNVGSSSFTLKETDSARGVIGEKTNASSRTYYGFTAKPFDQQVILEDGSCTVKIYYQRNSYDFVFNPNGGNWDGSQEDLIISGEYEEDFDPSSLIDPVRPGYTFEGWNSAGGGVDGSYEADQEYTACWGATVIIQPLFPGDIALEAKDNGSEFTFAVTVDPQYEAQSWTYTWYVDGAAEVSGDSVLTKTHLELGAGKHTVSAKALMNGSLAFTKALTVTVE